MKRLKRIAIIVATALVTLAAAVFLGSLMDSHDARLAVTMLGGVFGGWITGQICEITKD